MYIPTILFFNKKKIMNGEMHLIAAKPSLRCQKKREVVSYLFLYQIYAVKLICKINILLNVLFQLFFRILSG